MSPTYEIYPGVGIGPFLLGDTLWDILDFLRTEKTTYPKVELAWDTTSPHKSDLTITLPHLTLLFLRPSQRLSLLTITSINTSTLTLSYEHQVLASPSFPLTRAVISRALGPTYSAQGGKLVYPGLTFDLHDDSARDGRNGGSEEERGDRRERVQSLTVTAKEEGRELAGGSMRIHSVLIQANIGITVYTPEPLEIILGQTTSQDLLLDLGPPLRKYIKDDDRVQKMWGGVTDSSVNYTFWNYLQFGLDFLISQEDNTIQKIIAHSNIPGTPLFQRYTRCPWQINTSSGTLDQTCPLSAFRSSFASSATATTTATAAAPGSNMISNVSPRQQATSSPAQATINVTTNPATPTAAVASSSSKSKKSKKGGSSTSNTIPDNIPATETNTKIPGDTTSFTQHHQTQTQTRSHSKYMEGNDEEEAMILDRAIEGGLDGVENLGQSRLVGFEGLVVEEDERSGGIASITVFKV